ncbi:unnamed protein product [Urochloa humidicola]
MLFSKTRTGQLTGAAVITRDGKFPGGDGSPRGSTPNGARTGDFPPAGEMGRGPELKSFLLRFIYVPHPHTAELISDVLHDVLVEWHLERKVSAVTLDNCSVNDNLMESIEDKLPLDSLMLPCDDGKKLLHMRCAAHILNLIVKDGTAAMDKNEGLGRIRDSVRYWSGTPKRHEKFEKKAAELSIKFERRLCLDCKTRWNSTYIMLSTAVEYKTVFARLALREKLFAPMCPTETDWKIAQDICDRLKMFFELTELLSGTKYVTANLFFPRICGIYLAIRKWSTSEIPMVEKMAAKMKEKFNKYWADVHGLMAVATVLDPRFKLHLLKALFTNIYGAEGAENKLIEIKELLYKLVKEYQQSEDVGTSSTAALEVSSSSGVGTDEVFDLFDQYMSSQPANSAYVRTELDLYLDEPTLHRTQDLDIVNWWKYGGIKFPTLQRIARDVMAIPVTSVASESVFSTGGRIISPHRSRLAPKMIEALMSMQAWSRADMLGDANPTIAAMMTCMNDEEESLTQGDLESTVVDA